MSYYLRDTYRFLRGNVLNLDGIEIGDAKFDTLSVTEDANIARANVDHLVSANAFIDTLHFTTLQSMNADGSANAATLGNVNVEGLLDATTIKGDGYLISNIDPGYVNGLVDALDTGNTAQSTLSSNVSELSSFVRQEADTLQANLVSLGNTLTTGNLFATYTVSANTGTFHTANIKQLNLEQVPGDDSTGLSGTVGVRTDVFTGGVVDGDLFQYNGAMYGNASGLTGFSAKTVTDLESRLAEYANSSYRLYVSTTGNDSNSGKSRDQAFRTVKKACSVARTLTVIMIEAGTYTEDNPIYVPPNVALVGDSLRNTLLLAGNPRTDYFHLTNMNYLIQLRFVDLRSPGYCCAFPCSIADPYISGGHLVPNKPDQSYEGKEIDVLYSPAAPNGYYTTNLPPIDSRDPAAYIEALFDGMAMYIHDNTNDFPAITRTNPGGMNRAAELLRANTRLLQHEVMLWVVANVSLTSAQQTKCRRDVGLLVHAVATDLEDGEDIQSLAAAVAYYDNSGSSILSPGTSLPTARAVTFLGVLAGYVAQQQVPDEVTFDFLGLSDTVTLDKTVPLEVFTVTSDEPGLSPTQTITYAIERMEALLNLFANIVERTPMYPADATSRSIATGPGQRRVAEIALSNVTYLQNAVLGWVEANLSLSDAQKTKCARDVGYILEALASDLLSGGYLKTRDYAVLYYDNASVSILPGSQQEDTADAIRFLRDTLATLVRHASLPDNVFDQSGGTSYESLMTYKNLNGTQDQHLSITLSLPAPKMYVGYRLAGSNLKKFRMEARETLQSEWITIHEVDDVEPLELDTDTSAPEAAIVVEALANGIAASIMGSSTPFSEAAFKNVGGFDDAATLLVQNLAFIQAEVSSLVDAMISDGRFVNGFSQTQKDKCIRDVVFIVSAISGDLRKGGFLRSLESAEKYAGNTLSSGTAQPTADALEYIGALAKNIVQNTPVPTPRQYGTSQIFAVLREKNQPTYGTNATRGFSYYRLVMLQNQTDGPMKVGSLEFLEMAPPTPLCDGPTRTNGVVKSFEIIDPGNGIIGQPTFTLEQVSGDLAAEDASFTVYMDLGKVARIELNPKVHESIQDIAIDDPGEGYTVAPRIEITPAGPSGSGAEAICWIDRYGRVVQVELISAGEGYLSVPTIRFVTDSNPAPTRPASATISMEGSPDKPWTMARGSYDGPVSMSMQETVPFTRKAIIRPIMEDDYAEVDVPLYQENGQRNIDEHGRILKVRILHPGSGYVPPPDELVPTISIPAPESIRPIIVGSPYVQNCTNLSGPWDTTGEKVPVTWPLPWNVNDIYNNEPTTKVSSRPSNPEKGIRVLDNNGSGGGIRIDGHTPSPLSPLRSFVCDAFTQVNQGGIGFLLLNQAYAQFVSTFGTFCNVHAACISGATANFSNSVTDFGRTGLLARGYFRTPYLTGRVRALPAMSPADYESYGYNSSVNEGNGGYVSRVAGIRVLKPGDSYNNDEDAKVTIAGPADPFGVQATASSQVVNGEVASISVDNDGEGYKAVPDVTVDPPDNGGETARAKAILTNVSRCRVKITGGIPRRYANNRKPDSLSIVRIHGFFYTVTTAAEVLDESENVIQDEYDITFGGVSGAPPYVDVDHDIEFFYVSQLSTGSHVFEFCGDKERGCTYNSLPEYGGDAGTQKADAEIDSLAPAKIYFTSSDHLGNQRIGDFFEVNQATGSVALDASELDLRRIEQIGPFLRNGIPQGVAIKEVSTSVALRASTGVVADDTVPTQNAVKTYVDRRAVPLGGTAEEGYFLRLTNEEPRQWEWQPFTGENLGLISVVMQADVINGMVADGDSKFYGDIRCFGTIQAEQFVTTSSQGVSYTLSVDDDGVISTRDVQGAVASQNLGALEVQSMHLADASTLEYVADILRTMGHSGFVNVRQYNTLSTYPYGRVFDSNYGALNIHDHPNWRQLGGMAEISLIANGYYIRTRHNDYSFVEQVTGTQTRYIQSPSIPPSVQTVMDAAGSDPMDRYEASDALMAEYMQAFRNKAAGPNTSDWKNHFNVVFSYVEVWIQPSDTFGDQFDSERHFIDADAIKDLLDKAMLYNASGHKQRTENVSFQHTTVRNTDLSDGKPQFSNVTWRIRSKDLGSIAAFESKYGQLFDEGSTEGLLHPRPDHAQIDRWNYKDQQDNVMDAWWNNRRARFRLDESRTYRSHSTSLTVLDDIMAECPGLNGLDGEDITEYYELYLDGLNLSDTNNEFRSDPLVPLNAKFYNRRFTMSGFDASGRVDAARGFNDPNLFVSLNTQDFCTPNEYVDKSGTIVQYRYSYALPLEMIVTTPLEDWNPLNMPEKATTILKAEAGSQVGPQTDPPRTGYNGRGFFHLTPSIFYDGASENNAIDPADTNKYVVYILPGSSSLPGVSTTTTSTAMYVTTTVDLSTLLSDSRYLYYVQFGETSSTYDTDSIQGASLIAATYDPANDRLVLDITNVDISSLNLTYIVLKKGVRMANSGTRVFTQSISGTTSSHLIEVQPTRLRYPIYEQYNEGSYESQQTQQLRKELDHLRERVLQLEQA